jgi:cohesin loading factor subunit SCC2
VLPELPLPSPLPHIINNKSLLFDKKIAEQAKAVLATKNEAVISQLVNALRQTNTDSM